MAAFLSELFGLGPKNTRQPGSRNDRMEDGFLVVGETSGERSTLQPGQGLHIDRPPSYNNAQVPTNYHNPFRQPQSQYPGGQTDAYINYMNSGVSSPSLQSGGDTVLPTYREAQSMPSWRTNRERLTSLGQSDEAAAANRSSREFDEDGSTSSVVSAIPFKLSPVLESRLSLNKVDGALSLPLCNMRDFEYNFALEMHILQEYDT